MYRLLQQTRHGLAVAAAMCLAIAQAHMAPADPLVGDRLDYDGSVVPVTTDASNPNLPGWTAAPEDEGTYTLTGLSSDGSGLVIDQWPSPSSLFTPTGVFDDFTGTGSTIETELQVTEGRLFLIVYDGGRQFQIMITPDRVYWLRLVPAEAPSFEADMSSAPRTMRVVIAGGNVRIYVDGTIGLNTHIGDGVDSGVSQLQISSNDVNNIPSGRINSLRIATGAQFLPPALGDRLNYDGSVVPVTSDPDEPNIPGWTATPIVDDSFDMTGLSSDGDILVLDNWPSPYSLFSPLGVFDDFFGEGSTLETRIRMNSGRLTFVLYDGERQFQVQFRTNAVFWLKLIPAEAPSAAVDFSEYRVVRFVMAQGQITIFVDGVEVLTDDMGQGTDSGVSRLQVIALDGNNIPSADIDYLRIGTGAITDDLDDIETHVNDWTLYQ